MRTSSIRNACVSQMMPVRTKLATRNGPSTCMNRYLDRLIGISSVPCRLVGEAASLLPEPADPSCGWPAPQFSTGGFPLAPIGLGCAHGFPLRGPEWLSHFGDGGKVKGGCPLPVRRQV